MKIQHSTLFVTLFLLASIAVCSAAPQSKLPRIPFERLLGAWTESGNTIKPNFKPTQPERFYGKFQDNDKSFVLQYERNEHWKFTMPKEGLFLATRYKEFKPKEVLQGIWDKDTETLHWLGQRLSGGEYSILIHLPKGGFPKTHLVMKKPNGKIEFEWKGSSKQYKSKG